MCARPQSGALGRPGVIDTCECETVFWKLRALGYCTSCTAPDERIGRFKPQHLGGVVALGAGDNKGLKNSKDGKRGGQGRRWQEDRSMVSFFSGFVFLRCLYHRQQPTTQPCSSSAARPNIHITTPMQVPSPSQAGHPSTSHASPAQASMCCSSAAGCSSGAASSGTAAAAAATGCSQATDGGHASAEGHVI